MAGHEVVIVDQILSRRKIDIDLGVLSRSPPDRHLAGPPAGLGKTGASPFRFVAARHRPELRAACFGVAAPGGGPKADGAFSPQQRAAPLLR